MSEPEVVLYCPVCREAHADWRVLRGRDVEELVASCKGCGAHLTFLLSDVSFLKEAGREDEGLGPKPGLANDELLERWYMARMDELWDLCTVLREELDHRLHHGLRRLEAQDGEERGEGPTD